jgi:hypothetical protein
LQQSDLRIRYNALLFAKQLRDDFSGESNEHVGDGGPDAIDFTQILFAYADSAGTRRAANVRPLSRAVTFKQQGASYGYARNGNTNNG